MNIWMETGRYVAEGRSPYELEIHLGYPPLWGFWCGLSYVFSNSILPGNTFAYILAIKIPIIGADLAIAWILLACARSFEIQATSSNNRSFRDATLGRLLVAFFLLNPYVLTVGVVWGMMDNLAALLVILVALALKREKYAIAGAALGLAIALKLYPVLFLFAVVPYLVKRHRGCARALRFLSALALMELGTIIAPFLVFRWDIARFLTMLVDQTSRRPQGISPIGILPLLINLDVQRLGPFDLQDLSQLLVLRLLWIPTICLVVIFLARADLQPPFEDIIRRFVLVYAAWLLTAPSVSEQNVETLLVLTLFEGASCGFSRVRRLSYGLASAIVFMFAFFNVPATSFLYPVYRIEPTPLQAVGKYSLPWIALAFASYLEFEAIRIILKIGSNRRVGCESAIDGTTVLLS